jgi:hypothetical protein
MNHPGLLFLRSRNSKGGSNRRKPRRSWIFGSKNSPRTTPSSTFVTNWSAATTYFGPGEPRRQAAQNRFRRGTGFYPRRARRDSRHLTLLRALAARGPRTRDRPLGHVPLPGGVPRVPARPMRFGRGHGCDHPARWAPACLKGGHALGRGRPIARRRGAPPPFVRGGDRRSSPNGR